jgi:hypothetical protein
MLKSCCGFILSIWVLERGVMRDEIVAEWKDAVAEAKGEAAKKAGDAAGTAARKRKQ